MVMLRRVLAFSVLAICVACPILELLDFWDRTVQTGNDTEYILVLISLCIGAAFAIARWIAASHPFRFTALGRAYLAQQLLAALPPIFTIDITASPPVLSLRI